MIDNVNCIVCGKITNTIRKIVRREEHYDNLLSDKRIVLRFNGTYVCDDCVNNKKVKRVSGDYYIQ